MDVIKTSARARALPARFELCVQSERKRSQGEDKGGKKGHEGGEGIGLFRM